eukprot:2101599-Prymnesium_polylepis.1
MPCVWNLRTELASNALRRLFVAPIFALLWKSGDAVRSRTVRRPTRASNTLRFRRSGGIPLSLQNIDAHRSMPSPSTSKTSGNSPFVSSSCKAKRVASGPSSSSVGGQES